MTENLPYMQACLGSAAACLKCAENASGEGCSKQCRTNAELASCTAKLMSIGAPEVKALVDMTRASSDKCSEMCGKHDNDHCQACANAARQLADSLRMYQESNS
ncbi:7359_t:CDS:2 [Paraglomus brasilianum]|uniref:7359_t:CDS:1 n=1 Tax=Paraglomus brasilianum TaxID=144538 RepID=A0A9N8ZU01_9GLOM|nr:7359_t:CDS:2 [Paraglomus brasilianum]